MKAKAGIGRKPIYRYPEDESMTIFILMVFAAMAIAAMLYIGTHHEQRPTTKEVQSAEFNNYHLRIQS